MARQGISGGHIFWEWLKEEKQYLENLRQEPVEETNEMEYYKQLIKLYDLEYVSLFLFQ